MIKVHISFNIFSCSWFFRISSNFYLLISNVKLTLSVCSTIISNTQKSSGKGSGWIIDSVIAYTISISKYNPLAGNIYIKLPKELDHPRKGLINIQNTDDNECFKWSIVRYLNPADRN